MPLASCLLFACSALGAPTPIDVREGLSIGRVGGGGGRTAVSADAIADLVARGQFQTPKAGDRVALANGGIAQWTSLKAADTGIFQVQGYLACTVDLPEPAVMLLEVAGGSMAYVNNEPRAGDPYSNGYLRVPAALHKGVNAILVNSARGRVKIRLLPVKASAMLDVADPTLPDVLTTDKGSLQLAVVVSNTTDKAMSNLRINASAAGSSQTTTLPVIAPMTIRKVAVGFRVPENPQGEKLPVKLELQGADSASLDTASVDVRIRTPKQVYRRTFVSRIDGSLQYYAVNPAQKPADTNVLVLTLHGAGVEAQGQADAYASKDWATLVAPTNRRPYGFDWEDIGRLDAIEVLEIAEKTIPHDPQRVVLTGHSMGGHGTWHVGLTFPDRFAAIGPSAGWSSFASYGGGGGRGGAAAQSSSLSQIMGRANSPGDTLSLVRNSLMEEVFILHGDSDTNVPVREARTMRAALEPFHPRLSYHEEKGADHWWGSKCVDFPPMFAVFENVRLPLFKDMTDIEFTTADPAVSGRCNWATIEQQLEPMKVSTIKLHRKDANITGTTVNVAILTLHLPANAQAKQVVLDGQTIEVAAGRPDSTNPVVLKKAGNEWIAAPALNPAEKNSARGGPFKQAFDNSMILVYGTKGTEEENAAVYASARMFAETLYYRGNGAVDVIADSAFDAAAAKNRNVILFGNADTNSAWSKVLRNCPIDVREKKIAIGDRKFEGDDLAILFLYPKADGNTTALVGAVAATGPAGQRVTDRLPLLASGSAFPDWIILGEDSLTKGTGGIRGAGYFANDWSIWPEQTEWGK